MLFQCHAIAVWFSKTLLGNNVSYSITLVEFQNSLFCITGLIIITVLKLVMS
jgi:hypothetical protein